jgi:predicted ATPase
MINFAFVNINKQRGTMSKGLATIHIRGYKSIKSVELQLGNLNILIGANGSGKSNFISVFKFLRNIVDQRLQLHVRDSGGAEKLLYYGSKSTESLSFRLDFSPNSYEITLKPSLVDNLYLEQERTSLPNKAYEESLGNLIAAGSNESKLQQDAASNVVSKYVFDTLKKWRVYHFHDTSASARIKKTVDIHQNSYLWEDAGNLAAFLYLIQQQSPKHYERIVRTIQMVVPMFYDFNLRPDPLSPGHIRLEWLDNASDYIFGASELSDGSLRFISIATMLLQPNKPDLILLDEPELGLHPAAIQILAGLLQKASTFSQIIISTQSAGLVSAFTPEDIIVVENQDNASVFKRLNDIDLDNWLTEYSLGQLWENNVFGGRP